MYHVDEWGSHPDDENDDCWTGEDFETLEEARVAFARQPSDPDTIYLELHGPDVYEVRQVRKPRRRRHSDDEWRREIAMQAGMGLGVEAYNDEMGY